jgi:hypothetical protein
LRRLATITVVGVTVALVVLVVGRIAERVVIGGDAATARARVEAEVRGSLDARARALRLMALAIADADSLHAAAEGDVTAARRLFAAADAALAQADAADEAVTAYAADGRPLAWQGRPSELPSDRLRGEEAWFFARGALGLRLIYVAPVRTSTGERIGTIAAEQSLGPAVTPAADPDGFQFEGRVAPVSIVLGFEAARTRPDATAFDVHTPSGARLLTAALDPADVTRARQRWRQGAESFAWLTLAAALVLLSGPLLDWRNTLSSTGLYAVAVGIIAAVVVGARVLVRLASPADWSDASVLSGAEYASPLFRPFLTSPFDFLATAATAAGLAALLLYAVEAWRLRRRRTRRRVTGAARVASFAVMQLAAGAGVAILLTAYQALLRDTVANTTLDLLHFSVHPWGTARLALHVGLIIWHATALACGVLVIRAALAVWSVPRSDWRMRVAMIVLWAAPLAAQHLASGSSAADRTPLSIALAVVIALVLVFT